MSQYIYTDIHKISISVPKLIVKEAQALDGSVLYVAATVLIWFISNKLLTIISLFTSILAPIYWKHWGNAVSLVLFVSLITFELSIIGTADYQLRPPELCTGAIIKCKDKTQFMY